MHTAYGVVTLLLGEHRGQLIKLNCGLCPAVDLCNNGMMRERPHCALGPSWAQHRPDGPKKGCLPSDDAGRFEMPRLVAMSVVGGIL